MGYVREPDDVDFIVCGKGLSKSEQKALSKIIEQSKARNSKRTAKAKPRAKKTA